MPRLTFSGKQGAWPLTHPTPSHGTAGGALSDELLARQLADADQAAAADGDGGSGGRQRGRGGRGGGSARKMGVRERLAAKLLRGRAVAAAVAETARVESELRRDKFGQRW